jgi:ATP-dependent protease ClpP protease subunit
MEILQIENKAAKIKLNETVHKLSVDRLIEEIGSVFGASAASNGADFGVLMNCAENAADTMEIEIHSPGGSILDGYRVYHSILDLRDRGVHVTAVINTLAASMASVIAMAADRIKIVKGGRMMIHEASTMTAGNAEDHARAAQLLDEMSGEIANIYAQRTGKTPDEMRDRMKKETWMGAEQAVKEGFADEIINGKFDTAKRASMNLLERLTSPSNEEAIAKIEALENAAQAHAVELADINAKLETAENALQEAVTGWQEAKTSLVTAEAKIAELETQVAEIPALKDAAEKTKEKVGVEASQLAASIGLETPLPDASNGDGNASKTPHLDAFYALKDAERSAYYNSNKSAIRKELLSL